MDKFIVKGGEKLNGEVSVSGAKNVALKALVAACLTEEEVLIENIPLISDFLVMAEIIKDLGGKVEITNHRVKIRVGEFKKHKIPLKTAGEIRTSSMFLAPLLARTGQALIPNPGGCRIGARPIDRIIKGLKKMKADISYNSADGYFHAKAPFDGAKTVGLEGINYRFEKNTHTGTETLILAAVLARGRTILENAAQEPEVDELIDLLNKMGAQIKRKGARTIVIDGVSKLHGAKFTIGPDRNEIVTFAVAGILTGGDVFIPGAEKRKLAAFLEKLDLAGAGIEEKENGIRFFNKGSLRPTEVVTSFYPGFMTDWQGPWAVLMTKAAGVSTIHETIYENRFSHAPELLKMGVKIKLFNPKVTNPNNFYNFNWSDNKPEYKHAVKIFGPTQLHNAVVTISDLRAGATLVLAALAARGESIIFGVEHLDRGYEDFEKRLRGIGANIKRVKD